MGAACTARPRSTHPIRALVAILIGSVGCNEIAGIHAPLEAPDLTVFVGEWTSTGQQVFSHCTNPNFDSTSPSPALQITSEGSRLSFSFLGCTLFATVNAHTATIGPDQSCTFDTTGGPFTISYYNDSTFTVSPDGSATLSSSGISDDGTARCDFANINVYQRSQP